VYWKTGSAGWGVAETIAHDSTSYTANNLQPETTYQFYVQAFNDAGANVSSIQDLVDQVWGKQPTTLKELPILTTDGVPSPPPQTEMSPFKFAKEVERVIEEAVRPHLKKDGGDLEVVDIKATTGCD